MNRHFMKNTPKLIEVKNPFSKYATQAFKIYKKSFPIEERDLKIDIQKNVLLSSLGLNKNGKSFNFIIGVVNNQTISFSIYTYSKNYQLGFLSYIAVKENERGKGYGSWIFQESLKHLNKTAFKLKSKAFGLCWEVERPLDTLEQREITNRVQRIDFYKKNGATLLSNIEYTAPPLRHGLIAISYYLMYCANNPKNSSISHELLKSIIDFALLDIYEISNQNQYYKKAICSIPNAPI